MQVEFMDFFGESVVGAGADDYVEKIAESHANRGRRNTIPMWGWATGSRRHTHARRSPGVVSNQREGAIKRLARAPDCAMWLLDL